MALSAVKCHRKESESRARLRATSFTFIACNHGADNVLERLSTASQPPSKRQPTPKQFSQKPRWMSLIRNRLPDILAILWLLERPVNTPASCLLLGGTEELLALKHKGPNILGPRCFWNCFSWGEVPLNFKELRLSSERPLLFERKGVFLLEFPVCNFGYRMRSGRRWESYRVGQRGLFVFSYLCVWRMYTDYFHIYVI